MKDSHRKKSLLVILTLYPIFLVANIKMELAAKIKATTDKTQGIFTMVDTILMKGWKAAGMKFRFYRSITGANDFKQLHENWGTYQLFDIEATPGIWYEYKVEVLEKGGTPFFLTPLEPVKGFRPPSKSIAGAFNWTKPYQYKGNMYLDWDFSDENGNLILPDSATYLVKYETEAQESWFSTLGVPSTVKIQRVFETTQSRLVIKILPGMEKVTFCTMVAQQGGVSRFHCVVIDIRNLPKRKPGLAWSTPVKPKNDYPGLIPRGKLAEAYVAAKSVKNDSFKAKQKEWCWRNRMARARMPQKQRIFRRVS